jgi:hypothetical protein
MSEGWEGLTSFCILTTQLEEQREEVDLHIARFLRQEGVEKETADQFRTVSQHKHTHIRTRVCMSAWS